MQQLPQSMIDITIPRADWIHWAARFEAETCLNVTAPRWCLQKQTILYMQVHFLFSQACGNQSWQSFKNTDILLYILELMYLLSVFTV